VEAGEPEQAWPSVDRHVALRGTRLAGSERLPHSTP
jgi:hypothetical protein